MRSAVPFLLLALAACPRDVPHGVAPATVLSAGLTEASASAPAPPPAPETSAVAEAPSEAGVRSEAEVMVERFLRDPSDEAKLEAVKRVLGGMCARPGRRDLQRIVAAHLAGGVPPEDAGASERLRRANALFLLKPCLDAHLDGAYVDSVVDYHRAEIAHHEAEAIAALAELLDLRPALRPELERWARLHAPPAPYSAGCRAMNGLAWGLLIQLSLLREGMPVAEAVAILGPANVDAETGDHRWYVPTGCHINPRLRMETRSGIVRRIVLDAA